MISFVVLSRYCSLTCHAFNLPEPHVLLLLNSTSIKTGTFWKHNPNTHHLIYHHEIRHHKWSEVHMHFGHRIVQCTSNQVYRICIRLSNGIESDLYRNCVKFAIKTTPPFDNMTLGKSFHLWWINRKNPLINHNPLPPRLIKTSNPGLIKKSRLVKKTFIDERSQRFFFLPDV